MSTEGIDPQCRPPDNVGSPHNPPDKVQNYISLRITRPCLVPSREGVSCPCQSKPCHAVQGVSSSKKQGGISKKQLRSLRKQVKEGVRSSKVGKKYAVVEVLCPPRSVPEVEKLGLRGLSLDTCTGWDLNETTLSTQEARNLILEMAATCSHSSGRKWPQVAASILLSPAATCSLLQPLEWPQVAASGRLTSSHGNFSTFSAANPRKLFHIFRG